MMGRLSPAAAFSPERNAGGGFMRGAFWCVITSTTPGVSCAALVSRVTMRPFGTVLKASEA